MRLRLFRGASSDGAAAHGGPTLRQMAAEFVIVVAGILVALAIDDWRQRREELSIRNEHLANIASEVRSNIETIDRVRTRALGEKLDSLRLVLAFLNDPEARVDDPKELLRALLRSASDARPWLEDAQYRALQNSGQLRLLRDQALADRIAGVYSASDTLYPLVARMQGTYPAVVNELVPAQMQAELNSMRRYIRPDPSAPRTDQDAPVVADDPDLDHAIDAIRARRGELLRLARNEAAVTTGQWYVLTRMDREFTHLLQQLAPWDREASSVGHQ